ncbi:MAG: hypothetical protein AVDCRST_MAG67-1392 [uncultured Solirubrobacteraceae bacterium]|uniref:Uncharacterized protein n=1 Tax=uncultured Solirubrobacteraceae bacterium TaxID=1162706 RepID=A0A6J4SFW0_9ACTN|nr:MAG: hypothetical protein AVDCRST_MAG67-1392 [uncultured Solirubrobacteraceae bacterium]
MELATGSEAEEDVRRRLSDLFDRHSLDRWTFSDRVVVAEGATPHSHPVITLATEYPHDTALLCSYLHEQLHWWSTSCPGAAVGHADRVFGVLRERYGMLPARPPEGCGSQRSNLIHLHVCWLEVEVLAELFGWQWARRRAEHVPLYRSIYRAVIEDREELRKLFVPAGMELPAAEEHQADHR